MATATDKNEPGRFLGEGVSFRAKLIGVLEVPEARGDRMCQEALADLKMAIRAAGEHKQRIQVHVAIDGLRLRDDKTGDSLYHHPVHKISFIAQDMTDSRAFGYIFGSPDTGHRFFGIKTDKAASQVVIAMRDLFQVVFELKKKEIELAKQQLGEGKSTTSSLVSRHTINVPSENKIKINLSSVGESSSASSSKPVESKAESGVAELVDLEQELSSLRRGLTQVEGLTPSSDPFGDSFIAPPTQVPKGLLPPPPSGTQSRGRSTPASAASSAASTAASRPVFSPTKAAPTTLPFDLATVAADFEPVVSLGDAHETVAGGGGGAAAVRGFDVFTELDPLGTGRSKPYVDKKLFFQELKNPPKKVLKDLVQPSSELIIPITTESKEQYGTSTTMTSLSRQSGGSVSIVKSQNFGGSFFSSDPFAETDPFDSADPFSDSFKEDPFTNLPDLSKELASLREEGGREVLLGGRGGEREVKSVLNGPLQVTLPPEPAPKSPRLHRQATDSSSIRKRPQPSNKVNLENSSPPPLPPKKTVEVGGAKPLNKSFEVGGAKPPPRPPHSDPEEQPPLPPPARKREPTADRSSKPRVSSSAEGNSSSDEYLPPAAPAPPAARRLHITLAHLLTCPPAHLADRLQVPEETLSTMTLPQLTAYLRSYLAADIDRARIHIEPSSQTSEIEKPKNIPATTTLPLVTQITTKTKPEKSKTDTFEDNFAPTNEAFVANFDDFDKKVNSSYDRYAAFREIQEQELQSSMLNPLDDTQQNGDDYKNDSDEKEDTSSVNDLVNELENDQAREANRSPLKSLDQLTLDSFNMFSKSVSPKPTQIESKIEDIKNVMKNLNLEQSRRSVSPRENVTFADTKQENANDRYAALREITITEPQEEFESLPPDVPKERKRSDEKSDGFDNSDFFDCIDNSSLSFSHVEEAFRKSPSVKEREDKKEEKVEAVQKQVPLQRQLQPPPRLSTGSMSDVASASSPDTREKSVSYSLNRGGAVRGGAGGGGGGGGGERWSALGTRGSPVSSDQPTDRQSSSSSRCGSPWEEAPRPRAGSRDTRRRCRHNSSGSRDHLDSGSGRDKDIIMKRDKRERERDGSRGSRESASTRERDRDRRRKDWDGYRDRDYSRESRSRDRDRERVKEYREERHRARGSDRTSWDEDDYSEGCGSGRSGRSSPRDRYTEHRRRRDERNYGSLGWRESRDSRRRSDLRQTDESNDRRYGNTLSWSSRRSAPPSARSRDSDRRRVRRDEPRHRRDRDRDTRDPHARERDPRFSNDFSPRERDREQSSPFDNDFVDTPASNVKKRGPYSSLEGTRFAFEPEETTASPLSASSTRARDADSPATRFRFDSDSVSPRSMFEDDFTTLSTPRARAASIAEEDENDLPPLRAKPQTHRDIKKSESVNIFVRETDPFEGDDFFACTGSDRAARRDNWPGDFQAFDNV